MLRAGVLFDELAHASMYAGLSIVEILPSIKYESVDSSNVGIGVDERRAAGRPIGRDGDPSTSEISNPQQPLR